MSVTRADREASLKKRYAGRVAAAPKRRGMGRGPGPGAPRGGGRPKSTGAALKRLLSYLEADRLRMGIAFFCVIVNTVATLTGSYMLRPIINRFIAPPDGSPGNVAGLFKGLTMMACVYLLGVIANYLQSRLMLEVAQSALVRIRTDLFTKMQKLPVRFYDTSSNGDLMSRFTNDVDTIGNMLSSTLVQLFSGTLSIIGTLFLMLYTNIWLTAVTLIMIPLMLRAGGEVAKRSQKYFSAQQSALGALNGYIEETITGQKVVKVFCHEEIAEEEFDILNRDLREKQIRAQFLGGMMGPVMNNLSQVNYSLTACIGGILCVVKNFDVGGLTVFLNFSRQFSRPINEISMQVSNVFSALAGAERVFSVMDEEPEAADDKDAVSMDGTVTPIDFAPVTRETYDGSGKNNSSMVIGYVYGGDSATYTINAEAGSVTIGSKQTTTETTVTTTEGGKDTTATEATTTATESKTDVTKATTTISGNIVTGTVAPGSVLYGDVNCDARVDITDAVMLNKAAAGVVTLNDTQRKNADCNGDEEVGSQDATTLLMFLVNIIKTLLHGNHKFFVYLGEVFRGGMRLLI